MRTGVRGPTISRVEHASDRHVVVGRTASEDALSFPRTKQRSLPIAVAFRTRPLAERLFGRGRYLRLLLNIGKVTQRLAYEASGRWYGEQFHNATLAVTPEQLYAWLPANARVLDIGCGHGRLARVAARKANRVVGIDHNLDHIMSARARVNPANVEYRLGDASDLPADHFDVVLLVHLLEHIENADELLSSLREVGALLVVEVPDIDADVLNGVRIDLGLDFSSDADHVREYNVSSLDAQLRRTGWEVIDRARGPSSIAALARARRKPSEG